MLFQEGSSSMIYQDSIIFHEELNQKCRSLHVNYQICSWPTRHYKLLIELLKLVKEPS